MLERSEINTIVKWLQNKAATLDYGSISVEIKLSGNRPPLIKKTISEQFICSEGREVIKE